MSSTALERPELVFALVGAAGTRLADLQEALTSHLNGFGYKSIPIRLSSLLENCVDSSKIEESDEYTRITHCQNVALDFRHQLNDGAALARAAIAKVREERSKISGNPDTPAFNHAFVLNQLKHPAEAELLREVYGAAFFLIAGHAPRKTRAEELAKVMAKRDSHSPDNATYASNAEKIIKEDMKQEDGLGQNTRDTYPLADFFANLGEHSGEYQVSRFIDLLFGHPFHTPYPDEYSMYQASSVSLRSSDENRQVGAVIVHISRNLISRITNADIVASGMNEVPRRGGGFYWHDDSPDGREQWLQAYRCEDRAAEIKASTLLELIEKIKQKSWFADQVADIKPTKLARELLPDLKGTKFMNIGEFMRTVHAEMAAIIDAARRGVAVNGLTMYVTTFPCHNCAKHIIAAGIRQVVYLEPYPKSRADYLHGEEIDVSASDAKQSEERVVFLAFSGIAPRQYQKVFSMAARGGKNGPASLKDWPSKKTTLFPRYVSNFAFKSSFAAERQALQSLDPKLYKWDAEKLASSVTY